jgi:signal transduction histidine kinase
MSGPTGTRDDGNDNDGRAQHSNWPNRRLHPLLLDVGLVLVSAAYSALSVSADTHAPSKWALTMTAAVGLLLRRRWPYMSLILALPGFAWGFAVFAVMIALYSVARRESRRSWVLAAATVSFLATPSWIPTLQGVAFDLSSAQSLITSALFAGLYSAAPTALGIARRTSTELRAEMLRRSELQQQRARMAAEHALERERAVLAREMHDVVSNQVSLIAVQAGALQVASPDSIARDVAGTIRALSVTTLDELRAMIEVLRAAGGVDRGPMPQPTLTDLPALIDQSGIIVHQHLQVRTALPSAVQRAIYRLVQEGITNARKHAPGAAVHLRITTTPAQVLVDLTADPPTAPPLDLPSAHHGLIGLRERAELLGGTLTRTLREDGTHTLRLALPTTTSSGPLTYFAASRTDHTA